MKTINCNQCRKKIAEDAKQEYLKNQYAIFTDCAFTMAVYSTVAALAVMVRRGRTKEYIQKLYEDILCIYDTPELFGKPIYLNDLRKTFEKEYGLDFQRINVNIEDEKTFIKSLKGGSDE